MFDGMWHLEIPKCQESGKIEVIARNQLGAAYATTTLKTRRRRDDYRSVLKDENRKERPEGCKCNVCHCQKQRQVM